MQQLSSKHIRRFRAELPVSAAVKHAGKSGVMSVVDYTVMSSASRDPASLPDTMRTPNWFFRVIKPTCLDSLLASVCEMMTDNFMDAWPNGKNNGFALNL